MATSLPKWRYNILFGAMILICLGLAGQHALMIHDVGDDCRKIARSAQRVTVPIPAQPGTMYIRNHSTYAAAALSSQSPSCYADPEMFDDAKLPELTERIGKALNMDKDEVQRIIDSRRDSTFRWLGTDITAGQLQALRDLAVPREVPPDQLDNTCIKIGQVVGMEPAKVKEAYEHRRRARFVWLKRDIAEEEVAAVKRLKKELRLRAIDLQYEWRRHYPTTQMASSVIGFVNKAGEPSEGMEVLAAHWLKARNGVEYILGDVGRRFVEDEKQFDVPPRDGNNVFLTIDSYIQGHLEQNVAAAVEKHAAKWGVGVVMNPNTGEVLAMCTAPTFDPNRFNDVASPDVRKNRCFTDPYEPGSAFKSIIAAAAVNAGLGVTWQTRFNCEGGIYGAPGGGVISDHGAHYGMLTLEDIIVFSSNIGMAKVGEKFGNEWLYKTVHQWGFGSQVPIQLPRQGYWPGGTAGIVREPAKTWDGYSLRRVPFGQEISVSAMQLANAYCALVNGGELLQPRLIDSIMGPDGKKVVWRSQRKVMRRVLSPQTSRSACDVMGQVVERGTGKACKMDLWSSGGKTGTAQIAWKGTYPAGAFTSTFVGFAPVSKPALVCVISVYWPTRGGHYGAQVAAPGVKEVLEKSLGYLNVPPDRQPRNSTDRDAAGGRVD